MYRLSILLTGVCFFLFSSINATAQDTTDLMNQLQEEVAKNRTEYTRATFMSTRIVDGQSVENLHCHVLDVRISHRFGPISSGIYNLLGLDNATMRLGFDYGITDNLMMGIGHSTYQKTYDGFFKIRIFKQSSGKVNMPVTISFAPVIAINTLKQSDTVKTPFSDRISTVYQLLVARKISENFALQLMPVWIHEDKISFGHIRRNVLAMGIGVRQKISNRININAEYYYQLPDTKAPGSHNVFSLGIDIGTGGHVFQLIFTNSAGITEKSFISETTGRWNRTNIMFGFNISKVFQLKNNH